MPEKQKLRKKAQPTSKVRRNKYTRKEAQEWRNKKPGRDHSEVWWENFVCDECGGEPFEPLGSSDIYFDTISNACGFMEFHFTGININSFSPGPLMYSFGMLGSFSNNGSGFATFLIYNFTGAHIPAYNSGELFHINFNIITNEACMSEVIVSDADGGPGDEVNAVIGQGLGPCVNTGYGELESMSINIDNGVTLIGIPLYLDNTSLLYSFGDDSTFITGVISEGEAAIYDSDSGWMGSLTNIESDHGYWITSDSDGILNLEGQHLWNLTYDLHLGANLIGYSGVEDGLQNTVPCALYGHENNISGVIGNGQATLHDGDVWVGSLTEFKRDEGYWIKLHNDDSDFQYYSGECEPEEASFIYKDFHFPIMDQTQGSSTFMMYQNPSNGVYEWSINDVVEYIEKQLLTGGVSKPKKLK
jgi:hypothetical protein